MRPRDFLPLVAVRLIWGLLNVSMSKIAPVVIHVGVPMTTILSVLMPGERIRWRRGPGIALTLDGVLLVVWHHDGVALSPGLWFVVAAAFAGSLGAILVKQIDDVAPLRFQTWVGLVSCPPLT